MHDVGIGKARESISHRFDFGGHCLQLLRSFRRIPPWTHRGTVDNDALVRDRVRSIFEVPPGSFRATQARIKHADHVTVSAP
jgi:hypothetical protein